MAFAAVISLKHTTHRLLDPTVTKIGLDLLQLLDDVLERLNDPRNKSSNKIVISELDAGIREAVYRVEDLLESCDLDLSVENDKSGEEEISSCLFRVKKLKEDYDQELRNPTPDNDDDDDDDEDSGGRKKSTTTTVGLSGQLKKTERELLDTLPELKIVSLVGMAGIGKTLLARKLYQRSIDASHFKLTAWATVGPKSQIKDVLTNILNQIAPNHPSSGGDVYVLGALLYQTLHGRRYMIVLDDVWDTKVLDHVMRFVPDKKNGSRILLTTRLEQAAYPATYRVHKMPFLSNEESWHLLWMNVFDEGYFPPELEDPGRKIAEKCEGLPLLVLVVADILRGLEKSQEFWRKVAEKRTSTFTDAYEKISKVLSSSYDYLPQYLKVCFLYMGAFPQGCEIPLSKLISLWGVEDFLEPNENQTFHDFAMECLQKLVYQNLVIVCKRNSSHKIKSVKLHSAYWHVSVKESRKNKFLHVLNKLTDAERDSVVGQRRLSVQNNVLFGLKEVYESIGATKFTARSLLCTGEDHRYPVKVCLDLVLLQVLDALSIRFYEFPEEVVKLLLLRYLALTQNGKPSSFISKLENLQILILRQYHNIKLLTESQSNQDSARSIKQLLRDSNCLPKEIWEMQELRQLQAMGSNLPDPSEGALLSNLITLSVNATSCTKAVFRSTPYLKKLRTKIELQPDSAETISCLEHVYFLDELQSLKCVVVNPRPRSNVVAPPHHLSNLPRSLRKLSLNGLGYSWKYMNVVGSMPNLQVLKLRCYAFQGEEWEMEVDEFPSLEILLLEDTDLEYWTAFGDGCFPFLQRLILLHCYKLKEIPWQIEEISTLKTIEIGDCSSSAVASVQEIQNGQSYNGNDTLQVVITSSRDLR